MKIGIVGYQGSGKSTLFQWLTGEAPDLSKAHSTQSAMAAVPEPRVAQLCDVYKPKKITLASLQMVDTPGLSRSHEGSAAKLAMIREAACLVMVFAAYDGSDTLADIKNFEDDLMIADLEIVSGRVERLRESVKKPRPNRDEELAELHALEPLLTALGDGKPIRSLELTPDQQKAIRSFQLFSQKSRLVLINTSEEDQDVSPYHAGVPDGVPVLGASLGMELELQGMTEEERLAFCEEMGVKQADRDEVIRAIMDASGQMLFFTAGEKEVRTWMVRKGCTAVEAADGIHSDLARGFIRAETMSCDDLFRLGSEREVKANNLMRQEPKDYVIQDGDILNIRHNA